MQNSKLFNMIEIAYLYPLRKKLEQEYDESSWLTESEQKLCKVLTEEQKEALSHYKISIENYMDELHADIQINVLNLGIQIGMELQEAFLKFNI